MLLGYFLWRWRSSRWRSRPSCRQYQCRYIYYLLFLFPKRAINLSIFIFWWVDAAVFDMEYTRWLEEHHRLTCELRAAVQEHLPENELRLFVDNCLAHYDVVMNLKGMVAKVDVFHLVSGMWKTPAERCFMWIGGFRPSELIKVLKTSPYSFSNMWIRRNMCSHYKHHMTLNFCSEGHV